MGKEKLCPNCDKPLKEAIYGMFLPEEGEEGKYLVMGCMIPEVMVDRGCRDCSYRIYVDGTTSHGIPLDDE